MNASRDGQGGRVAVPALVDLEGRFVHSRKLAALAALAILALAACGGSATTPTTAATTAATTAPTPKTPAATAGTTTTPAPTAGAAGPCDLLTAADVSTVTGTTYGDGALDAVGRCMWKSNGDPFVIGFVTKAPLAGFKSSNPGGADVTVGGHTGYAVTQEGTTTESLWVDVGGRTLYIEVGNMSWETSSAAAIKRIAQELATIAITNK